MKRSITLALASVPMVLATGMGSTAYADGGPEPVTAAALAEETAEGAKPLYFGPVISVAPGASGTVSVTCPSGVAVGGGGITSGIRTFLTDSAQNPPTGSAPNGWIVSATNTGTTTSQLQAYVLCLRNT